MSPDISSQVRNYVFLNMKLFSMAGLLLYKWNILQPVFVFQFQDGMNMPLMTSNLQESQPLLWNPSIGIQQMMLHDDLNLLPHRWEHPYMLLVNSFYVRQYTRIIVIVLHHFIWLCVENPMPKSQIQKKEDNQTGFTTKFTCKPYAKFFS